MFLPSYFSAVISAYLDEFISPNSTRLMILIVSGSLFLDFGVFCRVLFVDLYLFCHVCCTSARSLLALLESVLR